MTVTTQHHPPPRTPYRPNKPCPNDEDDEYIFIIDRNDKYVYISFFPLLNLGWLERYVRRVF